MSYYQTIYNRLRKHGLTEAGALAMLGNWDCESGCEPYRLQGDFEPSRSRSKNFVANCMNGSVSKLQFCNGRTGFGCAQWTSPDRQSDLWDYWKSSGRALDDPEMQTDFAIKEMPVQSPGLLDELRVSYNLYQCTADICRKFERPAVNNIDARVAAAERIAKMIDLDGGGDTPDPDPDPDSDPHPEPEEHRLDLRTIDKRCSGFPEVYLLQSVLLCRNYIETAPTDTFGSWLEEIVKKFQEDHGLTADGIVGPLSWAKLLERG